MERSLTARDAITISAAVAAVVLAGASWLPPLAAADHLVQDIAVSRLAPIPPQDQRICIIAITEDSLARLPYRSPLDRGLVADLVGALRAKGVRAIGLDLLIDQPTEPAKDAALRAALTAPGPPVVTLAAGGATPLTDRQWRFHQDFLRGVVTGYGNLAKDRLDGVVRRHVPRLDGKPSFPAALAEVAGVAGPQEIFTIAWRRPPPGGTAFPLFPAEAVAFLPAPWLAGKIALVGQVSPDADRHRTPLSVGAAATPGVEIQAQVLAQMLDGTTAPQLGTIPGFLAVMALAAAGTLAGMAGLPATALAVLAVGGAAMMWAAAAASVVAGGPLLSPLAPSLAWLAAIGATSALASVRERRARGLLMGLFAAHLSGPVAEQIWRHRDLLLRGGRPRPQSLVATVLFSDVEDFTPASEQLGPEGVMAWVESYLEAMTDLIVGHDGIVLRFIGDGILAAFGAPLPRQDEAAIDRDAVQAVRCALAMGAALDALNADLASGGQPPYRVRVGIVTGPMVGGSIGASKHLEYTLMGDVVNTAARLEAFAKNVDRVPGSPCRILVSGSTWARVSGIAEARALGEVALKGKEERVAVYQILGPAGCPRPAEGAGRMV